jgi:hypothetical protein
MVGGPSVAMGDFVSQNDDIRQIKFGDFVFGADVNYAGVFFFAHPCAANSVAGFICRTLLHHLLFGRIVDLQIAAIEMVEFRRWKNLP